MEERETCQTQTTRHIPLPPHTSQRRARRVRTTASARATDAHTHRPHERGRLQRAHGGRGRREGEGRGSPARRGGPHGTGVATTTPHGTTHEDTHERCTRMRRGCARTACGGWQAATRGRRTKEWKHPPARHVAAAQQSKAHHDAAGTRTRQYEEVHSATLDPHAEHDARRGATREHRTTQASGRHAEAIQPAGGPNHVDDTITTIATTMGRRVEKRRRRRCGQRTS